jgi:hypothetical protein
VKELGVKPSKMIAGHLQNHEDTWQSPPRKLTALRGRTFSIRGVLHETF